MNKKLNYIFFTICFVSFSLLANAQDRSLEYYLNAAAQNSPLLNDYNNQKLANLIDSLRIQAATKPQVTANSTNSYAPSFGGFGYDGAVTNGANFSQLITVSKDFTRKDYLNSQYEAIRLLNESLTITGKISAQDLIKSVTAQYITAYGDWQQVSFNSEMLALFKKEELILKNLTEKGVYRQTDYLSFLVTVQAQEIQIAQARLQYQNDFATLNYLAGITDTTTLPLPAPSIELALLPDAQSTVFYQQYTIDSLKLRNSDALIDYTYKPKISAYADGGYLTAFPSDFYKNFGVSVGLNIAIPIYDGRQRKMQHDKIAISERTRQGYRDFFRKQYDQQLAQLSQQLKNTQALIDQLNSQIKYTETLVEANRKLLETGDARMADYILAIGNYLNAKNTIRQNNTNKLQIINQINYWNKK
ncbi:TolC family protein [Sediminibacterium roseum]|uniref:TolC family protein n=1 Tax=Sediminibacterium roseum TaxID=1978412 RepID=A0ABW9ZY73_9BACT|nr:TolC family protein [Sediminibacterium roseum]NCI51999.1 TolC family protein [Sediminibacterium roseum]